MRLMAIVAVLVFWGSSVVGAEQPTKVKVVVDEAKVMMGKKVLAVVKKGDVLTRLKQKGKWVGVTFEKDGKEIKGWVRSDCVKGIVPAPAAGQGKETHNSALANLKFLCNHAFGQGVVGLTPSMAEQVATKTPMSKADYWVYVVIQKGKGQALLPYRKAPLTKAGVRRLAAFLSNCPENTITVTEAEGVHGMYYFGGGKRSEAASASPVLGKILKQLVPAPLPPRIYFRFEDRTRQLVISFTRDIKMGPDRIKVHPNWKPAGYTAQAGDQPTNKLRVSRAAETSFVVEAGKQRLLPFIAFAFCRTAPTSRQAATCVDYMKARFKVLSTTKVPTGGFKKMTGFEIMEFLAASVAENPDTVMAAPPFHGDRNKTGHYGLTGVSFQMGQEKLAIVILFCKEIDAKTKRHRYDFAGLGLSDAVLQAVRTAKGVIVLCCDEKGQPGPSARSPDK